MMPKPGAKAGGSALGPLRRRVILVSLIVLFAMGGTARAASPATISTSFGAAGIPPNGTTSLSYTITNPNQSIGLSSIGFTDMLPSGLVVATPNGLSNDCGGTPTATPGSGTVSLSAGSLGGGPTLCVLSVNVVGTTSGVKSNSVTVGSSAGPGNTSTATLEVWSPPFDGT